MTVPGIVATSGPGLCSFEGGLLLAAQVSGGVHFSQFQNGTWSSSPQAIPGAPPGGSPALASLGSTAVIAYNGTGGQLYVGTYTGSVWEGPTQKSGTTKMDVALVAVSSPAPSFVLIYTGTNSSLYWLSSADGTSWSGGSKLSTQASGPPALGVNAISQPSGLECVFAFQGGLFLLESSVSGNQWQWSSTAYELGWMGSLPTSPTLAEYGGLSWLFVPSEDGLLAATSNGSPWTPLEALPGTLPFSDTRACASVHVDDLGNQTLQISCVDNTGAVQVLSYDGKVWSPMPAATGPGAATGATGLVDFGGQATVFYISNDALLWDSFDDSTQQWVHNGAVPGIISPSDVSVATLGDSLFVAYLDGSQRVMVTGWNGETWWPAPKQESHDTGRSVSLAAYEDAVILAFVGTDGYLRATYNTALTATGSGWASDQKFEAAFRGQGWSRRRCRATPASSWPSTRGRRPSTAACSCGAWLPTASAVCTETGGSAQLLPGPPGVVELLTDFEHYSTRRTPSSAHGRRLGLVHKPLYVANRVCPSTMSPRSIASHLGHMVVKEVPVKADPAQQVDNLTRRVIALPEEALPK